MLDSGHLIGHLPGIGEVSATRIRGAAQTLLTLTIDDTPVRIDPVDRSGPAEKIVFALAHWAALRPLLGDTDTRAAVTALLPLARSLGPDIAAVALFSSPAIGEAEAALTAQVDRVVTAADRRHSAQAGSVPADPWSDFLADPARYLALLAELGALGDDGDAARGDLPDQIVEAVRAFRLDTSLLRVTLRGYQDFAARFALVQHKTLIGDEMGLGKTVEALAVATHLSAGARGAHHLVMCPAAVVTNWVRETEKHTRLPAHRLHGTGRDLAAEEWISSGGVAVTTFETLAWLEQQHPTLPALSLVIVDEAHYIKNPAAQRSQRSAALIEAADYAVLLTGTPMENRIDEFATLVGYLQPDLAVGASEIAPAHFRRQVAPAYLRRNQEDVLTELPELIEIDEELPLVGADLQAYTAAVRGGGFAQMRQVAMLQGAQSAKIARLVEIAEEAAANGRKILVFSFFLAVLDAVTQAVPGPVFGPLSGSVPAPARQQLVDEFTAAKPGAVLVSQITAGGVGLNIQAASVVVLCEPQLKPTSEWQAIARARRMGQLEAVQVHRLLSEDGVDQRLLELLARKSELFDDFARISETAGSAEEAYDVSETSLAREVIAAERARLEVGADA